MLRFIGRFFLLINFTGLYIALLLAISFKFQILSPQFWINSLQKADVYAELSTTFKTGIKKEVLQDLTERNILNFGNFLNGKDEIRIYIPLKKLPRNFVTGLFNFNKDEFTISNLEKNFGAAIPIQNYMYLSKTGILATISLIISIVLVVLSFWGIYRTVNPGEKLVFPGVSLIISSLIVFVLLFLGHIYSQSVVASLKGGEPVQILLQNIIAAIVPSLINFLVYINGAVLIGGVGLLFLQKPGKVAP